MDRNCRRRPAAFLRVMTVTSANPASILTDAQPGAGLRAAIRLDVVGEGENSRATHDRLVPQRASHASGSRSPGPATRGCMHPRITTDIRAGDAGRSTGGSMRFVSYYPRAISDASGVTEALWGWAAALVDAGHEVLVLHAGGAAPLAGPAPRPAGPRRRGHSASRPGSHDTPPDRTRANASGATTCWSCTKAG